MVDNPFGGCLVRIASTCPGHPTTPQHDMFHQNSAMKEQNPEVSSYPGTMWIRSLQAKKRITTHPKAQHRQQNIYKGDWGLQVP